MMLLTLLKLLIDEFLFIFSILVGYYLVGLLEFLCFVPFSTLMFLLSLSSLLFFLTYFFMDL